MLACEEEEDWACFAGFAGDVTRVHERRIGIASLEIELYVLLNARLWIEEESLR
jgi:hypothetical protein